MLLESYLLQDFVEKIIGDVGCNINIIDVDGKIVASGNKTRIGKYHEIGELVAKKQERIDIKKDDEIIYHNVKAGINLPFYYNNKMVGVIGMTGEPSQITDFVRVVKTMIELMYEQEMLKQKMYHRKSNKTFFMHALLNIESEKEAEEVINWAKQLGYDFRLKRGIVIVDVKEMIETITSGQIHETPETLRDSIHGCIKKCKEHKAQDLSLYISTDQILIIKATTKDECIYEYAVAISKAIKRTFHYSANIGCGSLYEKINDFKYSYKEAAFCMKYKGLKIGKFADGIENNIKFIHRLKMPYIMSTTLPQIKHQFFKPYIEMLKAHDVYVQTIIAYSLCNMNIPKTAQYLYLHRNTVVSRLNKIKDLIRLDPVNNYTDRQTWDLLSLYLLEERRR